jgi:NHS family xanthosine MFS transporter
MVDYNNYLATKGWSGAEFGAVFNSRYCVNNACTNRDYCDRWINAEKLYGILHISGFAIFYTAS